MSKIIVINGAPGSGKTTFERICKERLGEDKCIIYSTIEPVKELAYTCGWSGEKTPEARKFLSDFKDLLSASPWGNMPFQWAKAKIQYEEDFYLENHDSTDELVFFIDVREPLEIQKLKDELDAFTILIHNVEAEERAASNHADANVLDFSYDLVIDNNESLDEFEDTIDWLFEQAREK